MIVTQTPFEFIYYGLAGLTGGMVFCVVKRLTGGEDLPYSLMWGLGVAFSLIVYPFVYIS